ncbi:diphthine methyl ester synthase [Nematocida sp. AWRm77]|nr:diphthine methyl ester synthase [Nematocida sp. AWRm77]
MLSIIGLGLEPEDITLKGLKAVQSADKVYLEKYTSIMADETAIEKVIGRSLDSMFREDIEGNEKEEARVIEEAKTKHIALLVVGTPLFATTHTEVIVRAQELGVPVRVVHNASIQSVVGCCGLNSYGFGRTVSIPFFSDVWKPKDFLLNITDNMKSRLHTLCLLDIKINEPTIDTLLGKENKRYTRFMTISEAVSQIEEAAEEFKVDLKAVEFIGIERFGQPTEKFTYGTLEDLRSSAYGAPLHSLIVLAPEGNKMEREYVRRFFKQYLCSSSALKN